MRVISSLDVAPSVEGEQDGSTYRITKYIGEHRVADTSGSVSDDPVGFIIEIAPTAPAQGERFTVVKPHFHMVRQFQVFIQGDQLVVGKRPARAFDFHYADPSTPYGPFVSGKAGIGFFTLRPPRSVGGIHWMPGSRDKMTSHAGRNLFVALPEPAREATGKIEPVLGPQADGLAGFRVTLAAGQSAPGPDPASGDGQYHVVIDGELVQGDRTLPPLSLLWVDPTESAVELKAGPTGASVLVLQFPKAAEAPAA